MFKTIMFKKKDKAFTLIELSIVLVIIGLIVGGVLTGRDLIKASQVRAQVSQIEKYNTAVNTFRDKFGFLPGDIPAVPAAQFGFAPRGQYAGEGDGNGIIEGVNANAAASNRGDYQSAGETVLFWADLAAAKLVEGSFTSASATTTNTSVVNGPLDYRYPAAKAGNNGYVYAWGYSGGNYFAVSGIRWIVANSTYGTPSLTVAQAFAMDSKIDDGLPQSGLVVAAYLGQNGVGWVIDLGQGFGLIQTPFPIPFTNQAQPATSTSCVDNGNIYSDALKYSVTVTGNAVNCGLSFKFR